MISEGGQSGLRSAETGSSETNGSHLSAAGGDEYRYVLTVRPGGKEIWSAHVFRGSRWVCFLARGLVEHEQNAADEIEDVRGLVVRHIDSLRRRPRPTRICRGRFGPPPSREAKLDKTAD